MAGEARRGRPAPRPRGHLRGRGVLGIPRPSCVAEVPPSGCATTPRCGSAGPATVLVARHHRGRADRRRPAADAAGEPVLVLGGGSNLVVADDGLRRHRRRGRHAGIRADRRGRRPVLRRRVVTVAAGEPWDAFVARAVEQRLGRASRRSRASPARSGRPRSRTSAPTARRSPRPSRPSGSGTARCAAYARSPPPTAASATAPAGSRPTRGARRPRGHLPAPAGHARRPGGVRRAGPRAGRRARRTGPDGRGPRGRARAPARQGDGARPRRPRHLERRVVLHQPGASPPRRLPEGAPALAAGRRLVKTSAAWLIEHAGFGKGYGDGPARSVDQAHPGPDQPRRTRPPPTCSPWPARSATASRSDSASGCVNEPVLVGCEL